MLVPNLLPQSSGNNKLTSQFSYNLIHLILKNQYITHLLRMKNMKVKELPLDDRPREKLLMRGPQTLSDSELIAILLRTGTRGESVL